jgi:peroxiredoxin
VDAGHVQGTSPPVPERPIAPDFELTALDGSKVSLAALRGKPVLLFFWGSWSLAGRSADPMVQAMHEKFSAHGLKVLALTVRERSKEAAPEFLSKGGSTYTLLPEADSVAKLYGIVTYPTFVVVDPQGNIDSKIEGWKKDETGLKLADELGKFFPDVETKPATEPAPAGEDLGTPKSAPEGPGHGEQ